MRFLVDMPVTPDAGAYLRAAGHDAIHASSVGLAQATDHEIIEMARRAGRVVVTVISTIHGWCYSVMPPARVSSSSEADRTRTTRCWRC